MFSEQINNENTDVNAQNEHKQQDFTHKPKRVNNQSESRLTTKNFMFIDELFENGFDGPKAYALVYDVKNPKTANDGSCRILAKPGVARLIKERQLVISEQKLIEKPAIVKSLNEIIEKCRLNGDHTNALKALDILNKMGGFYAEKKPAINLNSSGTITVDFGGFSPIKEEEEDIKDSEHIEVKSINNLLDLPNKVINSQNDDDVNNF